MIATANGHLVRPKKFKISDIPPALIHEILDGKPLFRRGYRDVINKTKSIEDIMGTGRLQATLLDYLLGLLFEKLNRKIYLIGTGEVGLHLERRNNLSNDIAIFERSKLDSVRLEKSYFNIPPALNIEIDTDIEFDGMSHDDYVQIKTQKLLDFGSRRVIWFFTSTRNVMVAEPNRAWITVSWNHEIELLEGIRANVGEFLESEGFVVID